jgi:hypothetical protein
MCPHAAIYVSAYYYICVLTILFMCPRTITCVSSGYYMCPHTILCVLILLYTCPHTTICVLTLLYNCMSVLTLLYLRPHTSIYVSSQIQDLKEVCEVAYPDQPSCMHIFKLQFPDYYFHKKQTKGGRARALSLPVEQASSITLAALSAAERATWIEVLRIYVYTYVIYLCVRMHRETGNTHARAARGARHVHRGAAALLV